MWVFLVAQCVGVAQLVFRVFNEEIATYVAADLVCLWKGVNFGYSYLATLNWDSEISILKRYLHSHVDYIIHNRQGMEST